MSDYSVDIVIIGGGLIGATLLHALNATGLRCLLVDAHGLQERIDVDFDARSIALSSASVRILQMLKLWSGIAPAASVIKHIHVSEQGRFGSACLQNDDQPLGYVVEMQLLHQALRRIMDLNTLLAPARLVAFDKEQRIATVIHEGQSLTIQGRLFVAADGSDSLMRQWCQLPCESKTYDHHALVANIGLARPHHDGAYERFTTTGPLALLPLGPQRMALVWSMLPEEAVRLSQVSDTEFLQTLTRTFGYRLGRLVKVGRRVIFPLKQVITLQQPKEGVIFIGNAAHTLHPVAGQGFNLGLRDVAMLVQLLMQHGLDDQTHLLTCYRQARQHDHTAITRLTDLLVQVFTHQHPTIALARQAGLMTLDNNRFLKRLLARYASGLAGVIPDLVCGIPL